MISELNDSLFPFMSSVSAWLRKCCWFRFGALVNELVVDTCMIFVPAVFINGCWTTFARSEEGGDLLEVPILEPRRVSSWGPAKDEALAIAFSDIHGMTFGRYRRQPPQLQLQMTHKVKMNIPLSRLISERYYSSTASEESSIDFGPETLTLEDELEMTRVLEEEGFDVEELGSLCT